MKRNGLTLPCRCPILHRKVENNQWAPNAWQCGQFEGREPVHATALKRFVCGRAGNVRGFGTKGL